MKIYAIIMAGGVGARFWPRSKEKTPKQLLKIFGDKTMIQETVERLKNIVSSENIFIITNKIQAGEIKNQLPNIPSENIIEEPFGRNTAACIGYASVIIEQKCKDAVTLVLPADHIIRNVEEFENTIISAAKFAYESKGLLTIGIPPSRPETGYGYIQIDDKPIEDSIYKVLTFAEKPNYDTAIRFLDSGDFLWNSGMFIWRVDSIIQELQIFMPELFECMQEIKKSLNDPNFHKIIVDLYGQLKKISIDYGVMEKSSRVFLIKAKFTWSDVGSWEEVYQLSDKDEYGNALVGNIYTDMTADSYIYSPDKFTAAIGVDNLIVINTKEALLICRRDQSQEVKKVVDHLKINNLKEHI